MRHLQSAAPTDTPPNWGNLKRLWPVLKSYRWRVCAALACLLLAKGAVLGIPFLLKRLVDSLDGDVPVSAGPALLLGLVVAYGGARFANTFFGELRDTLFGRVTERAMRRLGLEVFRHVHSLDLGYHLNRQTGGLARDIERGITGISFLMRFFVFNIAPTLFEIAMVAGILLVSYGPRYSLVVVAAVVAYGAYSFRATEWRTQFVRQMNAADSTSNTRAVDSLLNFETVKYFANEDYEARRYDEALAEWEVARRRNRLSLFTLNGGQALIIAVAQTVMIGLAAWDVRNGVMTLGDFVLVNQFMIQLFMPLGFLGFVYREIKGSMANIENMFRLLDLRPAITDQRDAPPLAGDSPRVEFRNVSFSYSPDRPILRGLSFSIEPGQKVAIVGASGAGKSTIAKLLFRFYDPVEGAILIGGQDIAEVTQQSLREHVGIVPQDTVLFNDTLLENVRYGRVEATQEEVAAAIRLAHLDHFIARLAEGAETLVGERGLKLSGGEKQRVSIARTILKGSPILVFDEATSSLDSRSEQAILGSLAELAREHTSLVIAHRLSTIVDADQILVLHDGEIVERGSHAELLQLGGRYAGLWHAQERGGSAPRPDTGQAGEIN